MNNSGFTRIATAIVELQVANPTYNVEEIKKVILEAADKHVEIVCFPELCITSYTPADLFGQDYLLEQAETSLKWLLDETADINIISIVGMPVAVGNILLNTAVVIQKGKILGIVPKTYLPNYKEFYEQRWFASSKLVAKGQTATLCGQTNIPVDSNVIFSYGATKFAIELCEDLWAPIPPSCSLAQQGANIIFNLSATNELISKHQYLCELIANQSARLICAYAYSSAGAGESTQDLVYGGNAIIYENGKLMAESKRFQLGSQLVISDVDIQSLMHDRRTNTTFWQTSNHIDTLAIDCDASQICEDNNLQYRLINPHPFVPGGKLLDERCNEIFSIQVGGLAKRIAHTRAKTIVVGISGGLDSTLALLVCVKAMDKLGRKRTDIIGITMPGFGTTDRTHTNATVLMEALGVTQKEISIKDACIQHFKDIEHDMDNHDVTYENAQARERTQILMDVANQLGGFVVGTGDLSELALGWATYNADHMSNYGVNCSIPKTLVRHLVVWVAQQSANTQVRTTLLDIADTPISPELLPAEDDGTIAQRTEDLVGPYELHDFFLYHFLRHGASPKKIYKLALRAFAEGQELPENYLSQPLGHYSEETIRHWLQTFIRRFFSQQFKRSCLPDGPKVGSVSLSPRGDWRMPSDAVACEEFTLHV